MDCFAYSLRGVGYSVTPMIISLTGVCAFRLFWVFVFFPMDRFHSLNGLALSYPISWTITGLIQLSMFIYVFKNKISFEEAE